MHLFASAVVIVAVLVGLGVLGRHSGGSPSS
jgi:hypothetical protein